MSSHASENVGTAGRVFELGARKTESSLLRRFAPHPYPCNVHCRRPVMTFATEIRRGCVESKKACSPSPGRAPRCLLLAAASSSLCRGVSFRPSDDSWLFLLILDRIQPAGMTIDAPPGMRGTPTAGAFEGGRQMIPALLSPDGQLWVAPAVSVKP